MSLHGSLQQLYGTMVGTNNCVAGLPLRLFSATKPNNFALVPGKYKIVDCSTVCQRHVICTPLLKCRLLSCTQGCYLETCLLCSEYAADC
jgi:hypothetical protein